LIIIIDNTAPTIDVLASDLTISCDQTNQAAAISAWLTSNGGASASDICGAVSWTNDYTDNLSDDCGLTGTVVVTFTATDDCGNEITTSATLTVEDNDPPTITVSPSDFSVECDGNGNVTDINTWLASNGGAIATDACSSITWTNDYSGLSDDCAATGSATVTFTATDDCGNAETATGLIIIIDNTAPTIDVPASDLTISCDQTNQAAAISAWLSSNGGAIASDICGAVSWTNDYTDNLSDDCGLTGTVVVTFTATDDCGNESMTSATLTVVDNDPPTITVSPSDLSVECDGSGNVTDINTWLASNGGAIATDACSTITWTNDYSGLSDDCAATGSATVTFTATDDCGNSETATGLIIIFDNTAPTIDVAASDLTISCDQTNQAAAISAWLSSNGGAIASDICGAVSWTNDYTDNLSDDCGLTGTVVVTFTATDDCGNESMTSATLTVVDNDPPTITVSPSDLSVECDGSGNVTDINNWLASNGGAIATDACSTITWTNNYSGLSNDCAATGSATVTFTATDDCGNAETATGLIIIIDNTAPTFILAAQDTVVECDGTDNFNDLNTWLANNGGALATDNCSNITWTNDYNNLGVNLQPCDNDTTGTLG
jgi:uncharacterized Zn-finger protein